MTPLVCEAVKHAPDPELAMWFDLGLMGRHEWIQVPAEMLLRLPFERTGVVFTDKNGLRTFLILIAASETNVTVIGAQMSHPMRYFHTFSYRLDGDQMRFYLNADEVTREEVQAPFRIVAACLFKLHGGNVKEAYKPTTKPSLINSKRKAKGKGPILFDWHTVKIEPAVRQTERLGGTHASPRLHDRRGHWRTYPSGKRGWVKACKVGDGSKGVVFKDYKIKEQE